MTTKQYNDEHETSRLQKLKTSIEKLQVQEMTPAQIVKNLSLYQEQQTTELADIFKKALAKRNKAVRADSDNEDSVSDSDTPAADWEGSGSSDDDVDNTPPKPQFQKRTQGFKFPKAPPTSTNTSPAVVINLKPIT